MPCADEEDIFKGKTWIVVSSQAYLATFKHKYHINKHVLANISAEQIKHGLIIESFTIKLFTSNSAKLSLNVVTEIKLRYKANKHGVHINAQKCLDRRKTGRVNDQIIIKYLT